MTQVNKNYGKLNENNEVEYAPSPLVIDGENVWTNIPELYLAQGYYRVVKTQVPVKEGYYYTPYWEQENETVIQKWEEHEFSDEPVEPTGEYATDEELQAAIREGVNSIDS